MATKLTFDQRKDRGLTALGEMQKIVDQINADTPGRERARLLRLARGRQVAVSSALARIAGGRFGRADYTDRERREAGRIIERAEKLYHHARRYSS